MIQKTINLFHKARKTIDNMFFKYGINLFDSKLKEYGGFNHFIAKHIFKYQYTYVTIYFKSEFEWSYTHEDDDDYYDGFHNSLYLGYILISYGT